MSSTLLENRAQSAHSRTIRRSPTNNPTSQIKQRPKTSGGIRRAQTDVYNQETSKPFKLLDDSETTNSFSQAKSSGRTSSRKLQIDEIKDLFQNLAHDEPYICKVNCLALYRKLVHSIDLRKTPINCKLLYELQLLENRIIQENAHRDIRFHSLLEVLVPAYMIGTERNDPKNVVTPPKMSVYESANNQVVY